VIDSLLRIVDRLDGFTSPPRASITLRQGSESLALLSREQAFLCGPGRLPDGEDLRQPWGALSRYLRCVFAVGLPARLR